MATSTPPPAVALLKEPWAEATKHSGGTLLTHLLHVEALLAEHAACLPEAIGEEAEQLVYFTPAAAAGPPTPASPPRARGR